MAEETDTTGAPSARFRPGPAYRVASGAEHDMKSVYDLALILHDYMTRTGDMDAELREALSHLTAELMEMGRHLRAHWDAIYELSRHTAH